MGSCTWFHRGYAPKVHRAIGANLGGTGMPLMPTTQKKASPEDLFPQLGQIESEPALRKFLSRYKSLARPEVITQLSSLVLEKIRVNTREALHLADAALLIARRLRRKKGLAEGLRTKPNALYACGQNPPPLDHHQQAIKIYKALEA